MSNKELVTLNEVDIVGDNKEYFRLKTEINQIVVSQLKNQFYNYSNLKEIAIFMEKHLFLDVIINIY